MSNESKAALTETIKDFRFFIKNGYHAGPLLDEILATASMEELSDICESYGMNVRDQLAEFLKNVVYSKQPDSAEWDDELQRDHDLILANFAQTIKILRWLKKQGDMVEVMFNIFLSYVSVAEMSDVCKSYGREDVREQMANFLRKKFFRFHQPASSSASSSASVSSSSSSTPSKQSCAEMVEEDDKASSEASDKGGKGKGRGGKGKGGCKGVKPATVPSKPSRSTVTPTKACEHKVLGRTVCFYEEIGKCTFLHDDIYLASGQPKGWKEVTHGIWTGHRKSPFGISKSTDEVLKWNKETSSYEESSPDAFLTYMAAVRANVEAARAKVAAARAKVEAARVEAARVEEAMYDDAMVAAARVEAARVDAEVYAEARARAVVRYAEARRAAEAKAVKRQL